MIDYLRKIHFPVGMRTLKTALAVTISIIAAEQLGTSGSRLIYAAIGAMAAMENTFISSLKACLAQLLGVVVGTLLAFLLCLLPIPVEIRVCIGVVLIISLLSVLRLHESPVLACLILVTICTDEDIAAFNFALSRIWDTAIGLSIGFAVNMLILPYDNSRKIQRLVEKLDLEFIGFLEDMYDGDAFFPDAERLCRRGDELEMQLAIFADQRLFNRKRQRTLLHQLQECQDIARELLVEVRCLRSMETAGRLTEANRRRLKQLGANLPKLPGKGDFSLNETVLNFHISRALDLRDDLMSRLSKTKKRA